jgi:hypothetical protein
MYKKLLICSILVFTVLSCAPQYVVRSSNRVPDNSNYNNNSYSKNNNYQNNNNNNDYPDDYYYDYPTDYYPQTYYQSYYNDYRNSIVSINWNQFYRSYNLSPYQIQQIVYLNQQYSDFNSWNSYYNVNPDRWYYERFNALQVILGPSVYINFRNNYYNGYSPVVYFQNYRRTYYQPRYQVNVQYRNVNIVNYKVDRNTFVDRRANNGLYNPNHRNNSNGFQNKTFQNAGTSNRNNNGFRNGVTPQSTPSVRNDNNNSTRDNGFRTGVRNETTPSSANSQPAQNKSYNGLRNSVKAQPNQPLSNVRPTDNLRNNGFRSGNTENQSPQRNVRDMGSRNNSTTQRVQNSPQRSNVRGAQSGRFFRQQARVDKRATRTRRSDDSRERGR